MKHSRTLGILIGSMALGIASIALAAPTPVPKGEWAGLLKKLDQAESQGNDQKGKMELVLVDKAGKKRIRRAIFFQRGTNKRLVQFKYPASEAGLTVLIRGKSILLYLPQFRRIRRVAAHVKNQPFMGSDLSFDDMSTIAYSKTHDMLAAFKLAKGGYKLVLKPKAGGYKKLEILLRKDYLLRQIRYFGNNGKAIKQMTRSSFKKVGKYLFPSRLVVKDLRSGHKTIVKMSNVSMDSGISKKYFTRRYLKRELDI